MANTKRTPATGATVATDATVTNATTVVTEVKENLENKGEKKTMKTNKFLETRNAEMAAKAAAAKEAAERERLAAITPVTVVDTMDEVTSGSNHAVRNEDGFAIGMNGGKLLQEEFRKPDGTMINIAAETQEKLDELKEAIAAGLSGDGKFHKKITVNGWLCDCCGATLEELEEDIAAAKDYYQKHINGSVIRDIDVAEQLVDAGFSKDNLEEVRINSGARFILDYEAKNVMDLSGNTIVDLDHITSTLNRADIKTLLMEKLEAWAAEQAALAAAAEEDEDYFDEDCDEFDDDDDDDEDGSVEIHVIEI